MLKEAAEAGYSTILCFIGISGPKVSEQRVAMRISQGGHNVPTEKLIARFPRTLANLAIALREFPHVRVYDNDDLRTPFRMAALFENGWAKEMHRPIPRWLQALLPTEAAVNVRPVRRAQSSRRES